MASDCPRCKSKNGVWKDGEEPTCSICGWVDYSLPTPASPLRRSLSLRRGYAVPYRVDSGRTTDLELKVVYGRTSGDPVPVCPYDGGSMINEGTRNIAKQLRGAFRCLDNRHRVLLLRDELGEATGWL